MNEDEDAWSYCFPPSMESLPLAKIELLGDPAPINKRLSIPLQKAPLNPLTTKEDASSQISKDSTDNENESPKLLLRNLKEYEINEKSPKIITYRKSKRTISDGTFDSASELHTIAKSSSPAPAPAPASPAPAPASPASPPARKYDNKLYVDEFYKDSQYRYAIMKRNIEFHQLFKSLDLTDRLLDDFACALSREILLQGRCYISESYLCFNSSLLGWVTNLVIKFENITKIEKRSTAGLFPNGIEVHTDEGSVHTFATFLSRDQTYDLMLTVWSNYAALIKEPVEETKIESYLMSLDGDDRVERDESGNENLDESDVSDEFDDEPRYTNRGPNQHLPTEPKYDKIPQETVLAEATIDAPLGLVYAVLFDQKFTTTFIESHDGSELSPIPDFHPSPTDPTRIQRDYTYQRALNYAIGPKSTRCEVTETIEHMNFADYVIVTTTTKTPDVPLGGAFAVKTRYVFSWGINNTTNVLVSQYIDWLGKSWMKSVIEKLSLSGSTVVVNQLIEEVKAEVAKHKESSQVDENIASTSDLARTAIEEEEAEEEKDKEERLRKRNDEKAAMVAQVADAVSRLPMESKTILYTFFAGITVLQVAIFYKLWILTLAIQELSGKAV